MYDLPNTGLGNETQNEKPAAGAAGRNSFFLSRDMFPEGMADSLKPGEVIEFRIVAPPDQDGEIEVEYNQGEAPQAMEAGAGAPDEKEGDWESEAREMLNPQAPENEA